MNDKLKNIVEPHLAEGHILLDAVEDPRGSYLRIIIDSENSITLDETTSLTKNLKGSAEFETMYPNGYRLEVSTPGLDNSLKFPFQYKKNINRRLRVAFNDNEMEKEFVGSLLVANDEIVEIASAKKSIKLTYEQITDAKVMVSFK
jgi:ribosome maturation factor RimP